MRKKKYKKLQQNRVKSVMGITKKSKEIKERIENQKEKIGGSSTNLTSVKSVWAVKKK